MLLPISAVKALATCTDRQSSRYALGGIWIERCADGQPVAVATDGRQLVAYEWTEETDHPHRAADNFGRANFSALLGADAIKQIAGWKLDKRTVARNSALGCAVIDEHGAPPVGADGKPTGADAPVKVTATDKVAEFQIANAHEAGRFPKWRDVFSYCDKPGTVSVTLSAKYLAQLAKAAEALVLSDDNIGVTLTVADENSAVRFDAKSDRGRFVAVLMPLAREDGKQTADNGWKPQPVDVNGPRAAVESDLERLLADRYEYSVEWPADHSAHFTLHCAQLGVHGRYTTYKAARTLASYTSAPKSAGTFRESLALALELDLTPPAVEAQPTADVADQLGDVATADNATADDSGQLVAA